MVHTCLATSFSFSGSLGTLSCVSGLVVAGRVEGQLAEQFAGFPVDDVDLEVGDQQGDPSAGQQPAEADVVESAVVAQGDAAGVVDGIVADPVVDLISGPVGTALGRAR